jgi:ubiquinone/menaquinone biosynthesis C-methylase UbiE
MRLNLGCGRTRLDGYLGIDIARSVATDVLADIRALPFRDSSIDRIFASHVIEHVAELERVMREIHRVLETGGELEACVPYGLRWLYDPFHFRAFNRHTFRPFTYASAEGSDSLQYRTLFEIREQKVRLITIPFSWHVRKYLPGLFRKLTKSGTRPRIDIFFPLPFAHGRELVVRMEKP